MKSFALPQGRLEPASIFVVCLRFENSGPVSRKSNFENIWTIFENVCFEFWVIIYKSGPVSVIQTSPTYFFLIFMAKTIQK